MWILDHFLFSSPLQNTRFWEISYHFSYSHPLIFTTLGEMTDADKAMNPQCIGSNPADIRIRINAEIQV